MTHETSKTAQIYRQEASGSLSAEPLLDLTGKPIVASIADLDGDARADLAVLLSIGGIKVYHQSQGTISDWNVKSLRINSTTRFMAAGDLDGDLLDDLVASAVDPGFFVFYQDGSGQLGVCTDAGEAWLANQQPLTVHEFLSIAVGDVNGDGRNDLLGSKGRILSVYLAR